MNDEYSELYQRIQEFSLDEPDACLSFSQRLAKDNGWSVEYSQRVIEEYRKFAFLAVVAGHPVAPSQQIDQVWHLHLTYTRSYWQDFCPNVLQMPFHHEPSRGGSTEQSKIESWYNQTLESYRQFFGEIPPVDIWPDSKERFGRDLQFKWVNTEQNWIIPKPTLPKISKLSKISTAQLFCSLIFLVSLASTVKIPPLELTGAFRNPLNLSGPEFLGFYILLAVPVIIVAGCLRFLLLRAGKPVPKGLSLTDYEVAYLAGRKKRVVDTAIVSLVKQGVVTIETEKNRQKKLCLVNPLVPLSDPIERAVAEEIQVKGTLSGVRCLESPSISNIINRLCQLNLLLTAKQSARIRNYPTLLIGLLLGLGVAKIVVGVYREKPVVYLVMLCWFIGTIGLKFWKNPGYRSHYGDQYLKTISAGIRPRNVSDTDPKFILKVALFGPTVLANHFNQILMDLSELFIPSYHSRSIRNTSDSSGGCGGDGGCGGGGGGGGGGCGGCGG